jgi:hypothetical protein
LPSCNSREHDHLSLRGVRLPVEAAVKGLDRESLGGVAARAFLSTVLLLGRSPSPNKVFREPADAAAWLAPLATTAREAWTPDQILAAFAEVARAPR